MKRFVALLLAMLCLCSFAHAEELSQLTEWLDRDVAQPISELFAEETLMTTTGVVQPEAVSDRAILSFSVEAKGKTVAEASQKASDSLITLQNTLIAQGVDEQNIWHKQYDVIPNVTYHNSRITEEKVIDGYTVEITLCVRLMDISLVGMVIDAAMQSGAGSTHELAFESSTASAAYEAALAEAAQQAMEKAKKLSESTGMTLGQLVSVTELSTPADGEARVEVTYRAK